jgi:hypothetical protein
VCEAHEVLSGDGSSPGCLSGESRVR